MKALILVGGFGTRLRPLTFSVPKPIVEFCNKPIVAYQIEALAKVGVTQVILAINDKPQPIFIDFIAKIEKELGIKIICSQETQPLGTAGPLNLAKDYICNDNPEGLFFVFNSDVICDFPLEEMLQFHKLHGKEGTIILTKVEEPSKYGVVLYDESGKILNFIEKPKEFISNKINAGLYLFDTKILNRIPAKPTSIEREIFPLMAKDEQLYAFTLNGFWMDIGQPKDFLLGTCMYLANLKKKNPQALATDQNFLENVLVDKTAKISPNTIIGPNVIIGPGVVIEDGVRIQNSCILNNVTVRSNSWIADSIIGWKSIIGKWVRIEGLSVFGENVEIKDTIYINGAFIFPNKSINSNIETNGEIVI